MHENRTGEGGGNENRTGEGGNLFLIKELVNSIQNETCIQILTNLKVVII